MENASQKDVSRYREYYGVVIFLDALGMKGIWKNSDPNSVLDNWSSFVKNATNSLKGFGEKFNAEISVYAFSDTAVMTLKGEPIEMLVAAASASCAIILEIEILYGLYFRGCISAGKIYEDKETPIVLGPAVDEAAYYYSLPNLVGVYASPSVGSIIERTGEKTKNVFDGLYMQYDIPFKDRIYKNGWMVEFDPEIREGDQSDVREEFRNFKNLKEIAYYNLEHLDNVDAAEKWKNTLEFINFMITNKKRKPT